MRGILATVIVSTIALATDVEHGMNRKETRRYVGQNLGDPVNRRSCEKGTPRSKLGHEKFGRAIFHVQDCPMCQLGQRYRGLQEWLMYI